MIFKNSFPLSEKFAKGFLWVILVGLVFLINNNNTLAIDPSKYSLNPSNYSNEQLDASIRFYEIERVRLELVVADFERGITVTAKGDPVTGLKAVNSRLRGIKEQKAAFEEELAQRAAGTKKYIPKVVKPIGKSFEETKNTIKGMSDVEKRLSDTTKNPLKSKSGLIQLPLPNRIANPPFKGLFFKVGNFFNSFFQVAPVQYIDIMGREGIRGHEFLKLAEELKKAYQDNDLVRYREIDNEITRIMFLGPESRDIPNEGMMDTYYDQIVPFQMMVNHQQEKQSQQRLKEDLQTRQDAEKLNMEQAKKQIEDFNRQQQFEEQRFSDEQYERLRKGDYKNNKPLEEDIRTLDN